MGNGLPVPTARRWSDRRTDHERSRVVIVMQALIDGLSLGALYALIAVGYTVVYGIIQLINFAHGEIFMMGAFGAMATWLVTGRHLGLWMLPIMLIGGMAVAIGVSLLTERLAYRPLRNAPRL